MSGIAPFSVLKSVSLTLTAAQIRSLKQTFQTLVPAAGANIVLIPLTFSAYLTYGGTTFIWVPNDPPPFTGLIPNPKKIIISLQSSISTTNPNPLWKTAIIDTDQTGNRFASGSIGCVGNYGDPLYYRNIPIIISAGNAYSGGTGSTITFTCLYYELTV